MKVKEIVYDVLDNVYRIDKDRTFFKLHYTIPEEKIKKLTKRLEKECPVKYAVLTFPDPNCVTIVLYPGVRRGFKDKYIKLVIEARFRRWVEDYADRFMNG